MTTYMAKPGEVEQKWWLVDATDQVVGRLAAELAMILMGKHRPTYTPHVDTGDYVIIINADKVTFSGNKLDQKKYINFSGYPGGKKEEVAKDLLKRRPEVIMERAIKGMLPKNRLGRAMYKKLFVYEGAEHPHKAQKPQEMKF